MNLGSDLESDPECLDCGLRRGGVGGGGGVVGGGGFAEMAQVGFVFYAGSAEL